MRLDWAPDVFRDAGLQVQVDDDWLTRGADLEGLDAVLIHHDAVLGGDLPSLPTLIRGRPDLRGPLCQWGVGDSGTIYVIAAGKANHAGRGRWGSCTSSACTAGFECSNDGRGEPWWPVQIEAMEIACAAIARHLGRDERMFCGHKEWALPLGRKIDPVGIAMGVFRTHVGGRLRTPVAPVALEEELMICIPGNLRRQPNGRTPFYRLDPQPGEVVVLAFNGAPLRANGGIFGVPLWRRATNAPPVGIAESPTGGVVVCCADGGTFDVPT